MNRHQRRRAARLRRHRVGYLHRVLGAVRGGALRLTPGVHATIEQDAGCGIYRGRCDCVPDISIASPDGVTVIDERGVGRKMARS